MCNEQTCCRVRFLWELSSVFEFQNDMREDGALFSVPFNLALEKVARDIQDLK